MAWHEFRASRCGSRLRSGVLRSRPTSSGWTVAWSAIRRPLRSELRTRYDRRPPRNDGDRSHPRRSLWQLTTRPPRTSTNGWGSGSQLPVESGGPVSVRAGRTAMDRRQLQVACLDEEAGGSRAWGSTGRAVHRKAWSRVNTSCRGRSSHFYPHLRGFRTISRRS